VSRNLADARGKFAAAGRFVPEGRRVDRDSGLRSTRLSPDPVVVFRTTSPLQNAGNAG
jgi:hypothetical protein